MLYHVAKIKLNSSVLALEPPKISVIIPHYDMSSFLPQAVKSVVQQDYKDVELIIIDDGSSEPIKPDNLPDKRIDVNLIRTHHMGKPAAVNRGFREASGNYLVILDADDQLAERSLSKRAEALKNGADLCIGSFSVKYDGEIQSHRMVKELSKKPNKDIIHQLLSSIISPIHQNTMMFSRDLLERVGGMDPQMLRGQDKDLAIRLLQKSTSLAFIDEPVYLYNRYDRPLKKRLWNRCVGIKYKLITICRHVEGQRKIWYLSWNLVIEAAKLVHDIFGVYKK